MSPSGEQGMGEPTPLVEQTVDETRAVTHGLVMVEFGAAARYSIRSIPTLLFVKAGAVVGRMTDAAPEAVPQGIVSARGY